MIGAWDKDTNVYFVITLGDKCRPPACSSQLSGHSLSYTELPPADANARHIPPFVNSVAHFRVALDCRHSTGAKEDRA